MTELYDAFGDEIGYDDLPSVMRRRAIGEFLKLAIVVALLTALVGCLAYAVFHKDKPAVAAITTVQLGGTIFTSVLRDNPALVRWFRAGARP